MGLTRMSIQNLEGRPNRTPKQEEKLTALRATLATQQAEAETIRKNAEKKIREKQPAGGAAPTPRVLPMPASQSELVDGGVYQTARGVARWNASTSQFTPVQ
jgi:hypothetical protein